MPVDQPVEPVEPVEPEADTHRRRRSRLLIGLIVLLTLTYWIWVFLGDAPENPDRLHDQVWTDRSERICAAAVDRLEQLPDAEETPGAAARADVVEQANVVLRAMVAELAKETPAAGGRRNGETDADIVEQWLADWGTYIDDRDKYADELREKGEALLLLTAKNGRGVDAVISDFALLNEMPSCADPGDVG